MTCEVLISFSLRDVKAEDEQFLKDIVDGIQILNH